MISLFRRAISRVRFYWADYLQSYLFLQTIRLFIVLPFLSFLFYKILNVTGVEGLTNQTLVEVLHSPWALLYGAIFLLVTLFAVYYELGYYFLLAESQRVGRRLNIRLLLRALNSNARHFLSLHSLLLMGYFFLVLPIASFGISPSLLENLKIPDFIVDELLLSPSGRVLYFSLLLLLGFIGIRLIYSLYFFTLDPHQNIGASIVKSWRFSRGKVVKTVLLLVAVSLLFSFVVLLFGALFFAPLVLVERFLPWFAPVFAGIALSGMQFVLFTVAGLLMPVVTNLLVEIVAKYGKSPQLLPGQQDRASLKGEGGSERPTLFLLKIVQKFPTLLLLFTLAGGGIIVGNIQAVNQLIYQPTTLIIAHRGFLEGGVENTLGSLYASKVVGADLVEMDIQETQDGQFVVIHDYNLKRLAGLDQEVRNMTLAELERVEVMQNGFKETIPSLKRYIEAAKALDIRLLIEVKPHGYETAEMAQNLVKLLRDTGVNERFLVQSLDRPVLDQIKAYGPEIQTGFILPLNIGALPKTEHDFLVLEEFSATPTLIQTAKKEGIRLFLWTINRDELMKRYLRLDIDGMITNHPDRALHYRTESEEKKSFVSRVRYFLGG